MCVTIRQWKNDVNSYDGILLLPTSGCQFNAFDSWSIRLCWLWYSYFSSIDSNNYVISHQPLIGAVHIITVPMFPIDHLSHSALGMSISSVKFSQSLTHVRLFAIPWTAACQASLSITKSHSLLKFMSIESVVPYNHLIFCCSFSSCLQSFPASGSFPMSQLFASGGQSMGVSASASVLAMNIQDWFPLGWKI